MMRPTSPDIAASPNRLGLNLARRPALSGPIFISILAAISTALVYLAPPVAALATDSAALESRDSPAAPPLDFKAAMEHALSRAPNVESAEQEARSARLRLKNARAAWLPTLDAQANHGYQRGVSQFGLDAFPNPHAPWTNALSFSLNETLYDNGESLRLAEIAAAEAEAFELRSRQSRLRALLAAAKAFYEFSNAFFSVDVQRLQVEALRKQFRIIENRYRQGMSSNRDFLRVKSQLERSEIGAIAQLTGLEEKKADLRVAIGTQGPAEFSPLKPAQPELDAIRFQAPRAEDSLEFRIAAAQDRASDVRVRSAERENWPRLSLKSGYNYRVPQYVGGRDPDVERPFWDFQASLVLDWTIWDWGVRRRNVEIADAQRRVERLGRESIRQQTAQDVRRLATTSALLVRTHRESRQALRDVETAYSSVELAYREGKATYTDLTQSLAELYSARSDLLNVQFSLLRTRADLAYFQGNLDEILGVR